MRTLLCLRILVLCLIAAFAGVLFARSDEPSTNASTSTPTVDFTLSNTATGAASDVLIAPFNLPSGTVNFGGVVLSGPGAGSVACAPDFGGTCPSPPAGTAPIIGDVMGTLSSSTFLGVANTPCSTNLTIGFVFINATVNNSAGNLIKPSLQNEADAGGTLSPLLHDVNQVSDHVGGDDLGKSAAGSAISAPNGLPAHVDLYPSYLNVVFDPDTPAGPNPPVQPLARYSGGQVVVGTSVILTNQYFAPGALAAFAPPHPYFDLAGTALGYTTISVLQDTTVEVAPTSITDFCTPLELTATTFGTSRVNPCNGTTVPPCNNDVAISNPAPGVPTGRTRATNPATAGTYYYGAYQFSQRDSDNDGLENAFDTCPYNANVDGDPRIAAGPDNDMLDSVCDPGAAANNNNQDGDSAANGGQWLNALDNCPLLSNADNNEFETDQLENVRRPRGGPATDSIGDVCDASESACGANVDDDGDGLVNDGCPTVGGAVAETTCTFSTSAEVDNDLDGYPNDGCPRAAAALSPVQTAKTSPTTTQGTTPSSTTAARLRAARSSAALTAPTTTAMRPSMTVVKAALTSLMATTTQTGISLPYASVASTLTVTVIALLVAQAIPTTLATVTRTVFRRPTASSGRS